MLKFNVMESDIRGMKVYFTTMRFGELERVVLSQEPIGRKVLGEDLPKKTLQRAKVLEMADYLVEEPLAFFSTTTLLFAPYSQREAQAYIDYSFYSADNSTFGELELQNSVLICLDGHYRVAAVKEALIAHPEVAEREIPALLVPYTTRERASTLLGDLSKSVWATPRRGSSSGNKVLKEAVNAQ